MKCIASFVVLALSSVATVLARKEVGRYGNGDNYRLYDDGKASLAGTYKDNVNEFIIPAYITVSGKKYPVSEIEEKVFNGRNIKAITIDGGNTGLVIKKNAFYGIKGLKEFNIYSRYVDAELGGFEGVGNYVQFQGSGIPNTVDKYCEKLLKKWNLPVGKNYKYVSDDDKKHDLFTLLKTMKKNFGIYDKVAYPDNAANVAFIGAGSLNGLTRLYRIMAIVMGVPYDEVLAGCDNVHYCWNYAKVVGFRDTSNIKKWHVIDYRAEIRDYIVYSPHSFQKESNFLNTLKDYYGKSSINPHDFVIHNDRYNYPYESRYNYLNSEKFDDWLLRNNGGKRTL